jgi:AcrR family transcriptional regulator
MGQATGSTLRQRQAASTRAQLLSAGRSRFATVGFHATTIDSIVEEIGATRGAFYRHFTDKKAMFDDVSCQVAAEVVNFVWQESFARASNTEERERHAVHLFLERLGDAGVNRIFAVDGPNVLGHERWRAIAHDAVFAPLYKAVDGWSGRGGASHHLVAPLTDLLAGMFQTAATRLATTTGADNTPQDYEDALVFILRALRAANDGRRLER